MNCWSKQRESDILGAERGSYTGKAPVANRSLAQVKWKRPVGVKFKAQGECGEVKPAEEACHRPHSPADSDGCGLKSESIRSLLKVFKAQWWQVGEEAVHSGLLWLCCDRITELICFPQNVLFGPYNLRIFTMIWRFTGRKKGDIGYSIDFSGPRLLNTLKLDWHSCLGSFVSTNLKLGLTVEAVTLNKSHFLKH